MSKMTYEAAVALFDYNPETGVILRRRRPREQFKRRVDWVAWNTQYAGTATGRLDSHGYIQVTTHLGRVSANRLCWLLLHGTWPSGRLTYVNHDRADNRAVNIIEGTAEHGSMKLAPRVDSGIAPGWGFWPS